MTRLLCSTLITVPHRQERICKVAPSLTIHLLGRLLTAVWPKQCALETVDTYASSKGQSKYCKELYLTTAMFTLMLTVPSFVYRGEIYFGDKAKNCEASGAIAAVIYNNEAGKCCLHLVIS
jgi:hypothetical protein